MVNRQIRLRDRIYPWIILKVGNGRTCRFWNDNWSPFGNLRTFLNVRPSTRLEISEHAKLSDLLSLRKLVSSPCSFRSSRWAMNSALMEKPHLPTLLASLQSTKASQYSSSMARNCLVQQRPTEAEFPYLIFLQVPPICLLCNSGSESRDHLLFFGCQFSFSLWSQIANRLNITPSPAWKHAGHAKTLLSSSFGRINTTQR